MATSIEIGGQCDTAFGAVVKAFEGNFASHGEVGAAVAVYLDGRQVVDLWGGYANVERTRSWDRDTIVNVYSTTKGMTAICAHRLVEQGKLDVDAPVARYWPEFAQAGKAELPVRYLLSHRAGLPAVKALLPTEALFDWAAMTAALAAQEPWWTPGTQHGYHALTFGWLVGEVVRRITGRSLGTYFKEEVASPLGADFHVGLDQVHDVRTAGMIPAPAPAPGEPNPRAERLKDPESMQAKVMNNPPRPAGTDNTREWRAAEIPAATGHGNARAIARIYGALASGGELEGVRVLTPESIEQAIVQQSDGMDAVLEMPTRFGLGFALGNGTLMPNRPGHRIFGHPGAGGSLGFADPDARVGFGYTMNQMRAAPGPDPRVAALVDAIYASI